MPNNPVNDIRAAGALRHKASGSAGPADEFQSDTLINPAGVLSLIGNQGADRWRLYGDGREWMPIQAAPPATPLAGQFWIETIAGTDTWVFVDSSNVPQYVTGNPGGANTQVQFNDSGAFGGDAAFTFTKATSTLTLTQASASANIRLVRSTTATGAMTVGAGGDRNTANTFDFIQFSNGAATGSFAIRLTDAGNADIICGGITTQLNIGVRTSLVAGTASTPGLAITSSDLDTGIYSVGANNIGFATGGVLRLDISTTAVTSTLAIAITAAALDAAVIAAFGTPRLSIVGANSAQDGVVNISNGNNAVGAHFYGAKTRSTGTDAGTIVQSGDQLAVLGGYGADGATYRVGALISLEVDGTPGIADMPGRIVLSTCLDGTATPVERMRLDNAGNVLIGTAALLTTATNGFLYVPTCAGTPTGVPTSYTGRAPIIIDSSANKLYFYSGGAWRDAGP